VTQTDTAVDRDKAAIHVALGLASAIGMLAAAVVALALTATPPAAPFPGY
jgi:hypothetical protein